MVMCASCGFLALREKHNGFLIEADGPFRSNGYPYRFGLADSVPLCLMQRRDFRGEYVELRNAQPNPVTGQPFPDDGHYVKPLLYKQIDCDEHTPWQQGFTAREHRDLLDRKAIWEREDRRDRELKRRHYTEIAIFGVFVILATIAAAILEGAISRGWEPGWWPF